MSRLTDLIGQLKNTNKQLAQDIEREVKVLSSRRAFGLNFERHVPEVVDLPSRRVRRGDKVRVLSARSEKYKNDPQIWVVKRIYKNQEVKYASIEIVIDQKKKRKDVCIDDLIVIAEFRDYIYPGLTSSEKVENTADKAFHTVINGENYHVLKALTFTHKGRVDAIYIDPPYNTGARDWKYNNDYVEKEDLYRHSKWLAFMERRLLVAKELLNPDESVLIVTIDEKEYLRLGLLLEQTFPEAEIQMIASVINPKGVARPGRFSRTDEYIFFVFLGDVELAPWTRDMLREPEVSEQSSKVRWASLIRSGSNSRRHERPNLFYPLFLDPEKLTIAEIGKTMPLDEDREKVPNRKGLVTIWPLRRDGGEATWQQSPDSLRSLLERGYAKVSSYDPETGRCTLYYLPSGTVAKIDSGDISIVGREPSGAAILEWTKGERIVRPMTLWNLVSHSASEHGASMLKSLIPGREFPFPKSLYAVEDTLRFFVANKPNAVVLDFFAGSGTTAHAVMRLNKQDGGNRQCICITNNEVSASDQKKLREKKLRPGDDDWEELGIFNYITKPRLKAALSGKDSKGKKISGDYKFTDIFPIAKGFEENIEFMQLTYESPISVSHNLAFKRIAPLLWMKAGSTGERIEKIPESGWKVVRNYALLVDLDKAREFCSEVKKTTSVNFAFIVTNDERRFQSVAHRLGDRIVPVRLYESYLKNFQIMSGF